MTEERKWGNGLSKKKKQTNIFILKITIKMSFKYDITRATTVDLQNSYLSDQIRSDQSLSRVRLFATP